MSIIRRIYDHAIDAARRCHKMARDYRTVRDTEKTADRRGIKKLTKEQIKEIRAYWGQLYDPKKVPVCWHRLYYAETGIEDPRFVPTTIFDTVFRRTLNDRTYTYAWGDKSYTDFFLRDVKTVRSVIRNVNGRFLNEAFDLITREEAQRIADGYDALVIKPSVNTHTGIGVKLIEKPFDLKALDREYRGDYVLQLPLKQHPDMAGLNASSVNTIRVNSVLFENEAHVMSAFVKVGESGSFADNSGSNRFFIGIRDDGHFCDYAIDHDLKKYDEIPSGYDFRGAAVPSFDRVVAAVEKAHRYIARFGFAYWDVCVDENGAPVIVEVNLRRPSMTIPQAALGPFCGKYTDAVVEYINGKRSGK